MHLLSGLIWWADKSVALADDGGVLAAADGVHEPVGVVVVDDVEEAEPAPGHPLHQPSAEVVVGDGDLHFGVLGVGVAGAQKDHLMEMKQRVRDGGGLLCID